MLAIAAADSVDVPNMSWYKAGMHKTEIIILVGVFSQRYNISPGGDCSVRTKIIGGPESI